MKQFNYINSIGLLTLATLSLALPYCSSKSPPEKAFISLENERNDIRAEISPDGSMIAFSSRDDSSRTDYRLYIMGINGTGLKKLLHYDRSSIKAPKWSPDGSKIAFAMGEGEKIDIYSIDMNGENLLQLTNTPGLDAEPAWSPDGSELIFHSNRKGNYQLFRMDANGQNQRQLIESEANDYIPDWSIDDKVAFTSDRGGTMDIWIVNLDGTKLAQLTSHDGREIAPVWSPDGKRISFHRNTASEEEGRGWNWDVYVMESDTQEIRITKDPGEDLFATWFPNGTHLLVPSQRGANGLFRFYSVDVSNTGEQLKFEPIPISP